MKAQKNFNQSYFFCYACEVAMPVATAKKKVWLNCVECGLWCCQECQPPAFKHPDTTPKSYFCNECALKSN